MRSFHKADWTDFYGDISEVIPKNAPEPRGKEIKLCMLVDCEQNYFLIIWSPGMQICLM